MHRFTLHYRRRHRTGEYTTTIEAFSDTDAREAVIEFEQSRGYRVTRFTDEPSSYTRENHED